MFYFWDQIESTKRGRPKQNRQSFEMAIAITEPASSIDNLMIGAIQVLHNAFFPEIGPPPTPS